MLFKKNNNKPFLYIISILFFHNRESAQVAFVKSGILNWWNADSIPQEYEITKILPRHKFIHNVVSRISNCLGFVYHEATNTCICSSFTHIRPLTRDITIRRLSFFRNNDKFLLTECFEKYFRIKGSEIRT